MTTSILNLNRRALMPLSADGLRLDWLNAKYANIRFAIPAATSFKITEGLEANAPGISFKVYQTTDYWWVILLFNGIINPITDLVIGLTLQLPSKEDIDALLSSTASSDTSATVTI